MLNDDLARTLRKLRSRVGRVETKPSPLYLVGTYTPTYTGATTAGVTTYSVQQGYYVRIGRLIVVKGVVVWTAATGTGNAIVSLPFTSSNDANSFQSGSLRLTSVTFANSSPQMLINGNSSVFQMDSPLTNAAPTTVAVEAAGNIVFTAVYWID